MLQEAEALLAARLRTTPDWPNAIRVELWPEKPQDFARPQNLATIFVRFAGLKLLPQQSATNQVLQTSQIRYELRFLFKDLRSHQGAYAAIERCQQRLTGWAPPPSDGYSFKRAGLQMLEADLVERIPESGQWDWGCIYAAELIYEPPGGLT
jgi:hypothetical protein